MKIIFVIVLGCVSFSMTHASEIILNYGDVVSLDNDTIFCGHNNKKCGYIAGKVYCGYNCRYIAGDVYCSSQSNEMCNYIAGKVYCGYDCKYIAGDVHCASGGLAHPAKPSQSK